ncbi:myocyte-specific enhancer factor 2d [Fusarium tjaetaba]|uniref:Myocyte-specific enhancer factor 2d n=1 Tax=Fusarium tjaetaba TaxID=1567544 RepID=A0A8H5VHR0_9HYPO|nr:myocyte-specific enhancer factor 2d [Fusarium tjaetaba]KAF5625157.1 myocyte-specific enhancer factor 2d [Fusarium tjaetaba]
MNREIPGYYYDNEKNKYFKIERTHTAPSSAAWSSDAVKRRKVEHEAQRLAERQAHQVKKHIKRHFVVRDTVTSALLAREIGLPYIAERGRGRVEDEDLGAAAWARGSVAKGNVPFAPSFARERRANMPCFYVSGDDEKTGLGASYATLDEETLVGSYIPTDQNDEIHFSREAPSSSGRTLSFRTEAVRCPQMSSIKYHQPSHTILLTSREPDNACGIYFFSPRLSNHRDPNCPKWLLGESILYQRVAVPREGRGEWMVHNSTPAPSSSGLICVASSNRGLLSMHSEGSVSVVAPRAVQNGTQLPQETFAQDFQEGNHNVVFTGGRQPRLWITDLRAPEPQWSFANHASSISHIKSVNPHQVLASGLKSSMALYDVRYLKSDPRGTKPLLYFNGHRNEAHFHIGWDVSPELNVVAAAQDNGTVKLFSLKSGCQLRCTAAETIHVDSPVKALMFQRMPRERMPSLFVGEGPLLRKFSFGTREWGDEA